jgi:hypothetical protein
MGGMVLQGIKGAETIRNRTIKIRKLALKDLTAIDAK